jgi:hypothetical protein
MEIALATERNENSQTNAGVNRENDINGHSTCLSLDLVCPVTEQAVRAKLNRSSGRHRRTE